MTTSTKKLIAILATAAGLLTANPAFAKNGGNNGNHSHGNGSKPSGLSLSFKSSPTKSNPVFNNQLKKTTVSSDPSKSINLVKKDNCDNHDCHKPCFDGHCYPYYGCYPNYGCIRTIYCGQLYSGQAFEPFHSTYIVLPGDSFYTVSLKEYGTSGNSRYIAQFNRLAENSALVPGQQLMLPSISANGALSVSRSPAAGSDFAGSPNNGFNAQVNTTPSFTTPTNFATPANFTAPVTPQPPRAKVAVGSTLLVDGQSFGDKSGAARLRVSGLSLPIEVLEWTTGAVKIRLPQVEITSSTAADIEVLRADGSVASKTAVDLTTATVQVALGK